MKTQVQLGPWSLYFNVCEIHKPNLNLRRCPATPSASPQFGHRPAAHGPGPPAHSTALPPLLWPDLIQSLKSSGPIPGHLTIPHKPSLTRYRVTHSAFDPLEEDWTMVSKLSWANTCLGMTQSTTIWQFWPSHYDPEAVFIHKNSSIHSYFRQLYIGKTWKNSKIHPQKNQVCFPSSFLLEQIIKAAQPASKSSLSLATPPGRVLKKWECSTSCWNVEPTSTLLKNQNISTFVAFRINFRWWVGISASSVE